jgi:hypothetical protein
MSSPLSQSPKLFSVEIGVVCEHSMNRVPSIFKKDYSDDDQLFDFSRRDWLAALRDDVGEKLKEPGLSVGVRAKLYYFARYFNAIIAEKPESGVEPIELDAADVL